MPLWLDEMLVIVSVSEVLVSVTLSKIPIRLFVEFSTTVENALEFTIGATFATTVSVIDVEVVSPVESVIIKLMISSPEKSAGGVYVIVPSPLSTIVPPLPPTKFDNTIASPSDASVRVAKSVIVVVPFDAMSGGLIDGGAGASFTASTFTITVDDAVKTPTPPLAESSS